MAHNITRCLRRWLLLVSSSAVLVLALPTSLALAEAADSGSAGSSAGAPCVGEWEITLSPGLGLDPSSGIYTSGGQTGHLVCDGTIDGVPITGPGTYGEAGRYGVADSDDCLGADGDTVGRADLTLPTTRGPLHLHERPARGTFGPLQGGGLVGGTFAGPRFHGTYTALPLVGDCVTAPITRVRISVRGWISDVTG